MCVAWDGVGRASGRAGWGGLGWVFGVGVWGGCLGWVFGVGVWGGLQWGKGGGGSEAKTTQVVPRSWAADPLGNVLCPLRRSCRFGRGGGGGLPLPLHRPPHPCPPPCPAHMWCTPSKPRPAGAQGPCASAFTSTWPPWARWLRGSGLNAGIPQRATSLRYHRFRSVLGRSPATLPPA